MSPGDHADFAPHAFRFTPHLQTKALPDRGGRFGLDVVTALCEKLLASGAPGLHFYTMNQADATTTIWQRLGL